MNTFSAQKAHITNAKRTVKRHKPAKKKPAIANVTTFLRETTPSWMNMGNIAITYRGTLIHQRG